MVVRCTSGPFARCVTRGQWGWRFAIPSDQPVRCNTGRCCWCTGPPGKCHKGLHVDNLHRRATLRVAWWGNGLMGMATLGSEIANLEAHSNNLALGGWGWGWCPPPPKKIGPNFLLGLWPIKKFLWRLWRQLLLDQIFFEPLKPQHHRGEGGREGLDPPTHPDPLQKVPWLGSLLLVTTSAGCPCATPPLRKSAAEFGRFRRFVGFLNFTDLFCRFVGFL